LVLSRNQFQAAIVQNNHRILNSARPEAKSGHLRDQGCDHANRLQPIRKCFQQAAAVVRDLSSSLGKDVRSTFKARSGADRILVEGLSDPLTHMVRNAIDHGIELPADGGVPVRFSWHVAGWKPATKPDRW